MKFKKWIFLQLLMVVFISVGYMVFKFDMWPMFYGFSISTVYDILHTLLKNPEHVD